MPIELKADAVKLFAEVGFLGLSRGQPAVSGVIFAMLQKLRPGEETGAIGAALTAMATDRADVAVKHLAAARQTAPVVAFAVLAHVKLGETATALDLLEDLEAMDAAPELLEMAQGALDEAPVG